MLSRLVFFLTFIASSSVSLARAETILDSVQGQSLAVGAQPPCNSEASECEFKYTFGATLGAELGSILISPTRERLSLCINKVITENENLPSSSTIRIRSSKKKGSSYTDIVVCKFWGKMKCQEQQNLNCGKYKNFNLTWKGEDGINDILQDTTDSDSEAKIFSNPKFRVIFKGEVDFSYTKAAPKKRVFKTNIPDEEPIHEAPKFIQLKLYETKFKAKFIASNSDYNSLDNAEINDFLKSTGIVLANNGHGETDFLGETEGNVAFEFTSKNDEEPVIQFQKLELCKENACKFTNNQRLKVEGSKKRQDGIYSRTQGVFSRDISREDSYSGTISTNINKDGSSSFEWNNDLTISRTYQDKWNQNLKVIDEDLSNLGTNYFAPGTKMTSEWQNSGSVDSATVIAGFPSEDKWTTFFGDSTQSGRSLLEIPGVDPFETVESAHMLLSKKSILGKAPSISGSYIAKSSSPFRWSGPNGPGEILNPIYEGVPLTPSDIQSIGGCSTCSLLDACPWCRPWSSDHDAYMKVEKIRDYPFAFTGIRRVVGSGAFPFRGFNPYGYIPEYYPQQVQFINIEKLFEKSSIIDPKVFGLDPTPLRPEEVQAGKTTVAKTPKLKVLPKRVVLINGLPKTDYEDTSSTFYISLQRYKELLNDLRERGIDTSIHITEDKRSFLNAIKRLPNNSALILFLHGSPLYFGVGEKKENVLVAEVGKILDEKDIIAVYSQACFGGRHASIGRLILGSFSEAYQKGALSDNFSSLIGIGANGMHLSTEEVITKIRNSLGCQITK